MIPLLNSIYSLFTGTGSLTTAFPGGMFRDRAAEGTAMPYVVSRVVGVTTQAAYDGSVRSMVEVKFSGFGVGHDATGVLMETFVAVFDAASLAVSAGINDSVVRKSGPTPVLHSQNANGDDVWEWAVVYEFGVIDA